MLSNWTFISPSIIRFNLTLWITPENNCKLFYFDFDNNFPMPFHCCNFFLNYLKNRFNQWNYFWSWWKSIPITFHFEVNYYLDHGNICRFITSKLITIGKSHKRHPTDVAQLVCFNITITKQIHIQSSPRARDFFRWFSTSQYSDAWNRVDRKGRSFWLFVPTFNVSAKQQIVALAMKIAAKNLMIDFQSLAYALSTIENSKQQWIHNRL